MFWVARPNVRRWGWSPLLAAILRQFCNNRRHRSTNYYGRTPNRRPITIQDRGPLMSRLRFVGLTLAVLVVDLVLAGPATADVYYVQRTSDLNIVEGELPTRDDASPNYYRYWQRRESLQPYATIEGEGEVYVEPYLGGGGFILASGESRESLPAIAIRTSEPRTVTGKLYLPKSDLSGMTAIKFTIPAAEAKQDLGSRFLEIKANHYRMLLDRDIPGGAWFRRHQRETLKQLGRESDNVRRASPGSFNGSGEGLDDTFALVSGGRAVSENLQLDRLLPESAAELENVPLDSLEGITVAAFDWKPLVKEARPERDPLARLIPDDQYALLFPSFQALLDLMDHAGETGTVALHAATPRSEDARVRERYERQLGLHTSQLSRLLGPTMIDSVAVTGADPYLRTGADIAVLFQAKNVSALARRSMLKSPTPPPTKLTRNPPTAKLPASLTRASTPPRARFARMSPRWAMSSSSPIRLPSSNG